MASPKFHEYVDIVPSESYEARALKLTVKGTVPELGLAVNKTTGGLFGTGVDVTVIVWLELPALEAASITVHVAVNVPAVV